VHCAPDCWREPLAGILLSVDTVCCSATLSTAALLLRCMPAVLMRCCRSLALTEGAMPPAPELLCDSLRWSLRPGSSLLSHPEMPLLAAPCGACAVWCGAPAVAQLGGARAVMPARADSMSASTRDGASGQMLMVLERSVPCSSSSSPSLSFSAWSWVGGVHGAGVTGAGVTGAGVAQRWVVAATVVSPPPPPQASCVQG
jgi:hypothetical protein